VLLDQRQRYNRVQWVVYWDVYSMLFSLTLNLISRSISSRKRRFNRALNHRTAIRIFCPSPQKTTHKQTDVA